MQGAAVRTYIPKKKQAGKWHWVGKEGHQKAVYANRAVAATEGPTASAEVRGVGRAELCPLLRHKRHVAGANLGLLLRNRYGIGTPRSLQELSVALRFLSHWPHARAIPKNTSYSPWEVTCGRTVSPYDHPNLCPHFSHSEIQKLTSPQPASLGSERGFFALAY
jgi:hypothetical protein